MVKEKKLHETITDFINPKSSYNANVANTQRTSMFVLAFCKHLL